jgi:hypothetical protein
VSYEKKYQSYQWIKVSRYQEDASKSWEARYKDLQDHHLQETTFLIEEVRRLARILDELDPSKDKKEIQ